MVGFVVGCPFGGLGLSSVVEACLPFNQCPIITMSFFFFCLLFFLFLTHLFLQTVQVKVFMEDIRQIGKLEGLGYTYWDERNTSKVRANNLI